MKFSLVNRLYAGFALVVILVVLGGILTIRSFQKQKHESAWVQHTYKVLNQLERINRLVVDMEASRRGFRATFERKYLQPYELNLPKITPAVTTLRSMVADNQAEERRVDSLENAINAILSYWNENDHRIWKQTFAENVELTDREVDLMDKIRTNIINIRTEEQRLLVLRENENEESADRSMVVLIWNNFFILVVGFILIVVTYKEFKRRLRAQRILNDKLDEVVELNNQANQRNWKLVGMDQMNASLQGILNVSSLSQKCLKELVEYGNYVAGAFYITDENKGNLRLAAGVAVPAGIPQTLVPGEGLTGQAALEKKIKVIEDIPGHYWKIKSATGETSPAQLILVPLWMDSEIAGVIELASFHKTSKVQLELLETQAKDIAVALNAASSRDKVMELLKQVQEHKEILINQQEELRQSNEELSRQSEVLQASEEELRVQEEELRQVNAEMTVKNKALEAAREALSLKASELEASNRYKTDFLANMSHELRTPLNSVLILAKMLEENKDNNLTARQREYATIIHRSGSELLTLINDILDLSKIEAGKIDINIDEVRVKEMQNDIDDLFKIVAQQKNIHFIQNTSADVPEKVPTDKQRLEQVIRNLLSNAFKFTPEHGTVKVEWYIKEASLCVSVIDTGMGIPEDKQQLIFEAFQQADSSTSRKFGGTGLGLSISRYLMKMMNGQILLESSSPEGSTFTISIPLEPTHQPFRPIVESIPAKEQVQEPVDATPDDDRANIGQQDKLILIVEDDKWFADLLKEVSRNKGFKTIVAHNGQEGLYLARKFRPVAIILDMNLPVIDGESILQIIRSTDDLKDILVHVVTAGELSPHTANNVNGYTQKPIQQPDMEKIFGDINAQLYERLKKVLIIAAGPLAGDPHIRSKTEERRLETQYDQVSSIAEARPYLAAQKYDGVIVELGGDTSAAVAELQDLATLTAASNTPVIAYLDKDISPAEEAQLKKHASAIVRSAALATDRLLDELELFLYKLEKVDPANVETLKELKDTENIMEGKTILLADDDMRNVFSISALLEAQGVSVLAASDGQEALDVLRQHPDTHLVLMDIMMPGMNGYEAMKQIRQDKRFTRLPIIALTAKAMADDRQKSIDAGASDYITKPVDGSKLLSLIRVWLS
ncbi:Signal transduction histidine kinase [Chitinophaga jiangningensis]|uniref:histidine kinase n=1 Tax=Chitinophaga jiangningensis TaxID=1419482 RepID=A0A1M7BQ33_9BACT|nr:response regulator [Chitinophaga jiangningensis]SHL57175.1 Signal transduction histidine kinase [Chitinophaga jiangningensis]